MCMKRKGPPNVGKTRRALDNKQTFRNFSKYSTPLRRLQWLRQELYLWDEAQAARPMPQPRDFGLNLRDLKPSEVHWGTAP